MLTGIKAFLASLTAAGGAFAGAALMLMGCLLYYEGLAVPLPILGTVHIINGRVENARHTARADYVRKADYEAAVAQKLKAEHDAKVSADALDAYRKAAEADQQAMNAQLADDERQIAAYEAGRKQKCPLSAEDWRFITGGGK